MNNNDFNNNVYPSLNQNIGDGYTQQPMQQQMNTGYTEQPLQNLNSNNYTNITPKKKENKNIKKILLIVIAILVIGMMVFAGYKFFFEDKTSNEEFDINETTAFFLQDSDSKYALFNEEGKQLTEFIYTHVGSFINGTAEVETDEQEGIINVYGKITVPLGKYKYITQEGGLYSVSEYKEESYNKSLVNGSGKILYNLNKVDVNSFIGTDTFLILEFEEENKYTVINYEGKELVSFPKVDDEIEDPSTNEEDGHISIFYNNKNWIFNVNTGKQLAAFDSELHYCVNRVSEDGNIITLNSCVSWFQSQDKTYYKFIKDGKLYDKTNECQKVWQNQGNLFCSKDDYKEYLLDANLNIGFETSGKAYKDNNNYAQNNEKTFNGVDFYQNGSIVKNVSCRLLRDSEYSETGIFILKSYYSRDCGTESGMYDYYKSNGEKLIEKSFVRAENFDFNGLAKVSEDKINYYLINEAGNQIGGTYNTISLSSDYYIITKDELKGIMNKEGKEILPCSYSKIEIITKHNKKYARLTTSDSKYIIYDLDKHKEVFSLEYAPNMNSEHYITTTSNNKTQYYTYSGKMFYEK